MQRTDPAEFDDRLMGMTVRREARDMLTALKKAEGRIAAFRALTYGRKPHDGLAVGLTALREAQAQIDGLQANLDATHKAFEAWPDQTSKVDA